MKKLLTIIASGVLIMACTGKKDRTVELLPTESTGAKELLQGIWVDDYTNTLFFKIEGDTIYYTNSQNMPAYFRIVKDTIYIYGNEVSKYKIDRQTENIFWFHAYPDNIIRLYRSDNMSDTLAFTDRSVQVIQPVTEVVKKDTVMTYDGVRYRAYAYINPSTIRVIKTTYSEDGMGYDNIYYDNIIHICIYQGKQAVFARDINKKMFEGVVDPGLLEKSVLADMDFKGIDRGGYHYQAVVCVPESPVCNLVNLDISFDGELFINKVED